jgi:DnaJ-class molecular chaperone
MASCSRQARSVLTAFACVCGALWQVTVTETGVTKPGQTKRVKGEGMPHHQVPSDAGDLIVK